MGFTQAERDGGQAPPPSGLLANPGDGAEVVALEIQVW